MCQVARATGPIPFTGKQTHSYCVTMVTIVLYGTFSFSLQSARMAHLISAFLCAQVFVFVLVCLSGKHKDNKLCMWVGLYINPVFVYVCTQVFLGAGKAGWMNWY